MKGFQKIQETVALRHSLRADDGGVHPAIAFVLMIAITVVLAAVLYTDHGCSDYKSEVTPTVGAVYQPYDNNFSVHVEKVDPDPPNHTKVNYILLDEASRAVPGVQGSLKHIYNLNFTDEYTNISYQDKDGDGMLSQGDVFFIKSKEYGGQAEAGYSLLLKYDVTGDKMNGGGTKLG